MTVLQLHSHYLILYSNVQMRWDLYSWLLDEHNLWNYCTYNWYNTGTSLVQKLLFTCDLFMSEPQQQILENCQLTFSWSNQLRDITISKKNHIRNIRTWFYCNIYLMASDWNQIICKIVKFECENAMTCADHHVNRESCHQLHLMTR